MNERSAEESLRTILKTLPPDDGFDADDVALGPVLVLVRDDHAEVPHAARIAWWKGERRPITEAERFELELDELANTPPDEKPAVISDIALDIGDERLTVSQAIDLWTPILRVQLRAHYEALREREERLREGTEAPLEAPVSIKYEGEDEWREQVVREPVPGDSDYRGIRDPSADPDEVREAAAEQVLATSIDALCSVSAVAQLQGPTRRFLREIREAAKIHPDATTELLLDAARRLGLRGEYLQ